MYVAVRALAKIKCDEKRRAKRQSTSAPKRTEADDRHGVAATG